jgi:hypothetical protein
MRKTDAFSCEAVALGTHLKLKRNSRMSMERRRECYAAVNGRLSEFRELDKSACHLGYGPIIRQAASRGLTTQLWSAAAPGQCLKVRGND